MQWWDWWDLWIQRVWQETRRVVDAPCSPWRVPGNGGWTQGWGVGLLLPSWQLGRAQAQP